MELQGKSFIQYYFLSMKRKFVLQLCKENGIEVVQGEMKRDDLKSFSEAFITSTTKEVCPVVRVDDTQIGDGKVGPVTQKLIELFNLAK